MEQIEISYTVNVETIKRAHNELLRRNRLFVYIPWLLMVSMLTAILFFINFEHVSIIHFSILAALLLSILIGYFYFKFYAFHKWVKELSNTYDFKVPAKIVFTKNSIESQGELVKGITGWQVFTAMAFGKHIILGFVDPKLLLPIPYEVFTPEQLIQFKVWARANVKQIIA